MHDRPRAAARDPFASGLAGNNSTETAACHDPACQCGTCQAFADLGISPGVALANRGPGALAGVAHRGPVQDESGRLDPLDDLAMRQVEGRP